jgi:hypothetical protein
MSEEQLTPVADGLWTVSEPEFRMLGLKLGTRMTIVRLPQGTLLLHSPVAISSALAAAMTRSARWATSSRRTITTSTRGRPRSGGPERSSTERAGSGESERICASTRCSERARRARTGKIRCCRCPGRAPGRECPRREPGGSVGPRPGLMPAGSWRDRASPLHCPSHAAQHRGADPHRRRHARRL